MLNPKQLQHVPPSSSFSKIGTLRKKMLGREGKFGKPAGVHKLGPSNARQSSGGVNN